MTDANANTTQYFYSSTSGCPTAGCGTSGSDKLTKIIYPDDTFEEFEYGANSNLIKKIDANGQITEYDYNVYNQLTKVYYGGKAAPVKTVSFSYDNARNMLNFNDGVYSAAYAYDKLNRIISLATVYPFATKTISYAFDNFGNKKTLTYPDSAGAITYNYDSFNRMHTLVGSAGTTTYDYDNASRLIRKTLPNGVVTKYTYDDSNRLTSLVNKKSSGATISSFTYTLDKVGNRKTMTTQGLSPQLSSQPETKGTVPESTTSAELHTYTYDDIYRLTLADHPVAADESFTYDAVGNRLTSTQYNNWSYDANNRLTSYNGTSYTYDDNGNTISKADASGNTNYTYDYENRLSNFQSPEHTASYTYDPFGKRLSKTVDGITKYYLYDNEDIIAEYDASGSLKTSYLHGQGIDEPIKGLSPQGTVLEWYYTFDGLGSVSELTNASQAVVESYKYDAFGKLETPPATGNPYTYTAREYDAESGLYFYRARYYDPGVGRFLSEDPIGFLGEINFYSYVVNNPIRFSDPFGLEIICRQIGGWSPVTEIRNLKSGRLLRSWIEYIYKTVDVKYIELAMTCLCVQAVFGYRHEEYLSTRLLEAVFECYDDVCPGETWKTTKTKEVPYIYEVIKQIEVLSKRTVEYGRITGSGGCTCERW